MVNELYLYRSSLVQLTTQNALAVQATFTHTQYVFVYITLQATLWSSITHIHTLMDASVGNMWFSALPKDTLTCAGKSRNELPTCWLAEACSSSWAAADVYLRRWSAAQEHHRVLYSHCFSSCTTQGPATFRNTKITLQLFGVSGMDNRLSSWNRSSILWYVVEKKITSFWMHTNKTIAEDFGGPGISQTL